MATLDKQAVAASAAPAIAAMGEIPLRGAVRSFAGCVAVVCVLFCVPLFQLVSLSTKSDLYSHIPLMPFIAAYLVWVTRRRLPRMASSSPAGAALFAGLGVLILLAYGVFAMRGNPLPMNDRLALSIGGYVCFLISSAFFCFGAGFLRVVMFPAALLLFLIPFPTVVKNGLEYVLQHSTAEATDWLLKLTPVPVHREGLVFDLPGISIQVAEECSGIRSSFVLFITAFIAGYMFLENPWNRLWFTLVSIPLGILRNGFRVVVISMLCVYVNPDMIHSPIHHRGGPIFFVLSLIPLFGVLLLFRKAESRKQKAPETTNEH